MLARAIGAHKRGGLHYIVNSEPGVDTKGLTAVTDSRTTSFAVFVTKIG